MHRRGGPGGELIVAATDLVGFLECRHLTNLELQADAGLIHKPSQREDPEVVLLQRRGAAHEKRYIELLESQGREVVRGDDVWEHSYEDRAAATVELMRQGVDVIYQATVFDGRWLGFPDFLLRKEGRPPSPSRLYRFDGQASEVEAQASDGAGIYIHDSAPAAAAGAGIYIHDSAPAAAAGAGIYIHDSAPAAAAGAGIYIHDSEPAGDGFSTLKRSAEATGVGLGFDWHYEVADTKLAHVAKASALIQIASYVEQIERIQGVRPDKVYVVTGGAQPEEHAFRTAEMMAYYRHAKQRFEAQLAKELDPKLTYPDPVEHCAVCKWYPNCLGQWHRDDALPLIAGISRAQRQALMTHTTATRQGLVQLTKPFDLGLKKSQDESMWRVREQARLQLESERDDRVKYELLEPERDADGALVADRGLSALPPMSPGDLFFDIEGDPFAFWEGLEYLFGVWSAGSGSTIWDQGDYVSFWAYDEAAKEFGRTAEKRAFEQVMDMFTTRWRQDPSMHIYHYGSYEPSHLKMLAGRHATREEELDQLLRGRVFVDLYRAVRQGVRVGAPRYSIKNLEVLYGYTREIELRDANSSIVEFETMLEVGDASGEIKEKIRLYNRDDCVSTEKLRDWLELRRVEAEKQFTVVLPRPPAEVDQPGEVFTERQAKVRALEEKLTASIPSDPTVQTDTDKATWLLRHLLDWHRRENKSAWWRFYELMSLSEDELVDEGEPIGQLTFVERIVREGKGIRTDDFRYRFPPQEHKIAVDDDVHDPEITEGKTSTGTVAAVDDDAGTVDIRRSKGWNGRHPEAIVPLKILGAKAQQESLMSICEWVATNGMGSDAPMWRAARDLLVRMPPRAGQNAGATLVGEGESGSVVALRVATQLDRTTLAIQGPPGSGKTYSGARMILELVRAGKKVGIAANSHKVISNLLDAVGSAADEARIVVRGMQKVDGEDGCKHAYVKCVSDNSTVVDALAGDQVDVVGGTAWLWSRNDMSGLIDTLFVDEAGQMSLANVVAMSGCARNIVLLGDPQQLDQPTQGVHPGGSGVSALTHLLGGAETVAPDQGVFLEQTWRMHPRITSFTSELFYEGKLESVPGLERQEVLADGLSEGFSWLAGSGLRWVPVDHDGNTNVSIEEADRVCEIWNAVIGRSWTDAEGARRSITAEDIVILTPFNGQRLLIASMLPAARVGTVDKFQGQEAAVSIYTMATSRPEDAPRGMAFLLSLNRLNVATSRARALTVVVASPRLLDGVPGTPDQLRMANGLTSFAEVAGQGVLS